MRNIRILILLTGLVYLPAGNAGPAGGDIYLQSCMVCHGDDGTGAMPGVSDLTENITWSKMPENELLEKLNKGIQGETVAMPPKGGNLDLTDSDLRAVLNYMRANILQSN
ncbi:MAG TPA: c-type cytochrome [Gammaproteobacteria bacterium]|jgi:cytochrome c5